MDSLLNLSLADIKAIESQLWDLVGEVYEHTTEVWSVVAETCPVKDMFEMNSIECNSFNL